MKITHIAMAAKGDVKAIMVQQQSRPIYLDGRLEHEPARGVTSQAFSRRRTLDIGFPQYLTRPDIQGIKGV
jgi:hypothetical protein